MNNLGTNVLVLVFGSDGDTDMVCLGTITLEDRAGIEHRHTASQIAADPLHIAIVIDQRALGIEIVGIETPILNG